MTLALSSFLWTGGNAFQPKTNIQDGDDFVVPEPKKEYFTQQFDHFNDKDNRTFNEQVLIYDGYFKQSPSPDAPVFLICGGEGPVRGGYDHDGLAFELALKLNGIVFSPEHRFYGNSLPFGPKNSYLPANLEKLTVQQALADYTEVLKAIKVRYGLSPQAKVVSVGGSYPGELASYLRMNKAVDFALASSAPVLYRPLLMNGTPNGAFFMTTTEVFARADSTCPDRVRRAFSTILEASKTALGQKMVSQQLGLCTVMESFDLVQLWIESGFATLVMENYPYAVDPFPAWPMDVACKRMLAHGDDDVAALRDALGLVYNVTDDVKCHDIREEYLECSDITGCGLGTDGLSWDYQFCTQVNANADTNNVTDMFPPRPFDFAKLSAYCQNTWGVSPTPLELPTLFNASTGDHIIYANGDIDGWFLGGILESRPEDEIWSVNVTLGAHHFDLRGNSILDTAEVRKARAQEKSILLRWLTN